MAILVQIHLHQKHTLRQLESSKLKSAFQVEAHLLSEVSDIVFA